MVDYTKIPNLPQITINDGKSCYRDDEVSILRVW